MLTKNLFFDDGSIALNPESKEKAITINQPEVRKHSLYHKTDSLLCANVFFSTVKKLVIVLKKIV
ncbi:hypothetical protein, partial [Klebsiella pneumoniae]|uniref:hypothetical protein n=1 Tax=Klebsiella pneumoniae TaxID=573 RepID=UPI0013E9568D